SLLTGKFPGEQRGIFLGRKWEISWETKGSVLKNHVECLAGRRDFLERRNFLKNKQHIAKKAAVPCFSPTDPSILSWSLCKELELPLRESGLVPPLPAELEGLREEPGSRCCCP
uniref:Uncharacterized protein n=1 Tax=Catharus ustulatus TaxID=91951 RepID=A0A8C3TTJ9_CATUS